MGAEENYSKVLVIGIPEVANGMLVHDGEDALVGGKQGLHRTRIL